MSLLYGRVAKVIVGPPGQIGKEVTDLRITFKIEKTSESNPNTATISVYNMAKDTRSLCEKKGNAVVLKCGYDTNIPLVFSGDIAKCTTEKQGPDIITTMEAGDGQVAFDTSTFDQSFAPGATVQSIFQQVTGSFGVAVGPLLGIPNDSVNNGMTLSGDSKKHMDDLTKKYGMEWSIQDGQIQVAPKNTPVFGTAVLLNSETGLIGSPKRVKILKANSDPLLGDFNKDAGVTFRSLLNPKLKPGQLVSLQSVNVTGLYTCRKVVHSGDTHSMPWQSECDAI